MRAVVGMSAAVLLGAGMVGFATWTAASYQAPDGWIMAFGLWGIGIWLTIVSARGLTEAIQGRREQRHD